MHSALVRHLSVRARVARGTRAPAALLCLFGLVACHADGPVVDPLAYLRVGDVEPREEAEVAAHALAEAGFRLGRRLEGGGFVALDALRVRDRHSVVRIYTARGVAMSLDAPDPRAPQRSALRLWSDGPTFELDGGPAEELVVEVTIGAQRCLAVVQVDEAGAARELPLPLRAIPGAGCAERLADVVGDVRPELLATSRLEGLGLMRVPTAPVVLVASVGRYDAITGSEAARFYASERERRQEAIDAASMDERLSLAAELALLARLEGASSEEAWRRFDAALVVLEPAFADQRAEVRAALAQLLYP